MLQVFDGMFNHCEYPLEVRSDATEGVQRKPNLVNAQLCVMFLQFGLCATEDFAIFNSNNA